MAADTTAPLVRFLNNGWLVLLFLIAGCTTPKKEAPLPVFNSAELRLQIENGLVLQKGNPFTGKVYTLQENKKDTATITGFRQGREDGEWKKFYVSGQLQSTRFFTNGKKTGNYRVWWPDGKLQQAYHFEDGEYNGLCREWNAAGQLIMELHYKNGYEEGAQKQFYDNGKIRSNYIMIHGQRYGLLGTKNCVNVADSIFKK